VTKDIPRPTKALVVCAHPDDAEFGCAGTIAKWAEEGTEAVYVVATDGSKGSWKSDTHPLELALRREDEQRKACQLLGASEVHFLRHPDGAANYARSLVSEIAAWIRRFRPDVVLSHDPWKHYILHPDHRAVGFAVCDAVVSAREHGFARELGIAGVGPHRPQELLLWDAEEPNHVETFENRHFETKIKALFAHASQFESTMRFDRPDDEEAARFVEKLRTWAAEAGALVGAPLGESFRRVDPSR
jgi:LmbE family N-acetylglucosaminyl deacetylase